MSSLDGKEIMLQRFINIFNNRNRARKDYWLLDISSLEEPESQLEDLDLDLDDDLFWFDENFDIWEVYKIHPDFDIKVDFYGNWTQIGGLKVNQEEKWNRRRNLEGAQFKVATLTSIPYITKMTKLSENEYSMEGMFAEVFFALQV